MTRLKGKVALITGAAGGIGAATARAMYDEGAKLVLCDLEGSGQAALAREFGDRAIACDMDVTSEEETANTVRAAQDAFGHIDIAVLNAGTEGAVGAIGETPLSNFDKVMEINVRGVFIGLSAIMPVMKSGPGGSIVILSSVAGRRGTANVSPYVTSKHAVVGLMKCAALEGAESGIRVNTVNPGPITTRMMESLEEGFAPGAPQDAKAALLTNIPMGRYGTAEEVAAFITFLSSDDASYCSGNIYGVDGGLTAG
ncbi:MAG: SDR family NAD(P)-dependent oxidoreductase [Novosphingobium sp.]